VPPPSLLPSASSTPNSSLPGVHLVGTGPGDRGLLTLAAVALMRYADVVLYDRPVSPEILAYVNPASTMICVG
jgi:siroheme synthase